MRNSLKMLAATTALIGLAQLAQANTIFIDATSNSGSVSSIAITQDAGGSGNVVAGNSGGTEALPIAGAVGNVSISQTGTGNVLSGSVKVAPSSGVAGDITASYTSASNATNIHSLTIGSTTGPATIEGASLSGNTVAAAGGPLSITMAATTAGSTANNTVTDTLDTAGTLAYTLNVNGHGNSVTNTLSGANVTLYVGIAGSGNTVSNTGTGTGGDKNVAVSLASSNNTVTNALGASSGDQTATLVADSLSKINYSLDQTAAASAATTANVALNGVTGASGVNSGQAEIAVTQGDGASANLTLYGAGYAFGPSAYSTGTYTGGLTSSGATGGQYSVVVAQSTGSILNANVTANAAGFTAVFKQ